MMTPTREMRTNPIRADADRNSAESVRDVDVKILEHLRKSAWYGTLNR